MLVNAVMCDAPGCDRSQSFSFETLGETIGAAIVVLQKAGWVFTYLRSPAQPHRVFCKGCASAEAAALLVEIDNG